MRQGTNADDARRLVAQRRWIAGVALAVVILGGGGWYLANHVFISEKTRIRRVFDRVARAAARKSAAGVVAPLVDDFRDPELGLDKRELRQMLIRLFMDIEALRPRIERTNIVVQGDQAYAVVLASCVVVERGESARPRSALRDRTKGEFVMNLEKIDGRWRIVQMQRPRSIFE